jgi:type IV pilus assembly protein PilV
MVDKSTRASQTGLSMIEVLVSLVIIMLGLLGIIGLQTRAHTASFESYQRTQAVALANQVIDSMRVNRRTARCFAITDQDNGAPHLGTEGTGYSAIPACAASTAIENNMADAAIAEWDGLLKGVGETKDGAQVGAMVGARGCVSYDMATELPDPTTGAPITGTGLYTVTVTWQGSTPTAAPAVACAQDLYGDNDALRRALTLTFRLAHLR